AMRAGLLVHLPQCGLAWVFAGPDVPLRQHPEARFLARRPDCGEYPPAFQPPHQYAPGREFSFHADESIPVADRLTWISGRAAKEKPQRGNVLAVGPGSRNDEGNIIPMEIAEGDEIIFSKYGGTEVKLGSDDVLILRESDVLAKVIGTREPAGAAA